MSVSVANRFLRRFDCRGPAVKCEGSNTQFNKQGIMDTEKNPNEREKQSGGQQGGSGGQQGGR